MEEHESWLDRLDYALEDKSRKHLSEVIDELAEEGVLYLPDSDDVSDKNNLYHLFKSTKQTGLCDRLKKYLNFDVYSFYNTSDKLYFVKYLYLIENDFPLIKILSNPTLADINIHNQLKQRNYEENLHRIALKIRSKLSDEYADRSDMCFYEIACDWMDLRSEIFNMIADAYFRDNQRTGNKRGAENAEMPDIITATGDFIKNEVKRRKKENHTTLRDEVSKCVSTLYTDDEPTEYDSFAETLKNYSEYIEIVVSTLEALYHEVFTDIGTAEIHQYMAELDNTMEQFRELTGSLLHNKRLEQYDYNISKEPYIAEYMQELDELVEKIKAKYVHYIAELEQFNGQDFDTLYSIQRNAVCNITSIIQAFLKMSDTEKINKVIALTAARSQSNSDKVDNIVQYLCNALSTFKNTIDTEKISEIGYRNGVFEAFYNVFNSYYVKRLFSDTKVETTPDSLSESIDVQRFFSEYADSAVEYDTLKQMEKILSGRSRKGSFEELFLIEKLTRLVRAGVTVKLDDADMRFAIKHLRTVIEWWMPDKQNERCINIIVAVTAMQELAFLYHTKEKFTYQFNKHDDKKTFSAMIAKPESTDRLAKAFLVNRLHDRFLTNIGGFRAVQNLQKIRVLISELVEVLTLYHNFEDVQIASYFMQMHIKDLVQTISEPPNTKEKLEIMISSFLSNDFSEIQIENSIYLTRLLHENESILQKLAESVAKDIETNNGQQTQFISEKKVNSKCGIRLFCDTKKGHIRILQLYIICADYERKKLKELCLENCIFNQE